MTEEIRRLVEASHAKLLESRAVAQAAVDEKRMLTGEETAKMKALLIESQSLAEQAAELRSIDALSKNLEAHHNDPVHPLPRGTQPTDTHQLSPYQEEIDGYLRRGAIGPEMRRGLSRLTDPSGGFLVSDESLSTFIEERVMIDPIRGLATVITTGKPKVRIPVISDDWSFDDVTELGALAEQSNNDFLGQLTLEPHKVAAVIPVSMELLEDADVPLEPLLVRLFARRLGVKEAQMFINGNGVNKPEGFLNAGITGFDCSGAAAVITPEDVQRFPLRLNAAYRTSTCRWIIPNASLQTIMLLRTNADGANTGDFLWKPGLAAGQPITLWGYPVIESEQWPAISADGDAILAFGDLREYWIADRVGLQVQRIENYRRIGATADRDEVGFKFRARFDGKLADINAIIRMNRN